MLITPVSFRPVTMQYSNNIQRSYASNVAFEGRRKTSNPVDTDLINEGYILYRRVPITTNNKTINANVYIKSDKKDKHISIEVENDKNAKICSGYYSRDGYVNANCFCISNEKDATKIVYDSLFSYIKEHHKDIKKVKQAIPACDEKALEFFKSLGFKPTRHISNKIWGYHYLLTKNIQ